TASAQTSFHPGTIEYMSPEQLRDGDIDKRSDLYSMGVTFYETLTGHLPFDRSTIGTDLDIRKGPLELEPPPILEHRPDLPGSVAALVMRALRKNPADRYQSANDFLDAIRIYEQQQAATSIVRATNGKTNHQPLIIAADPEIDPTRAARPSQPVAETPTPIAPETVSQPPTSLTTKIVSLVQSIPANSLDSDQLQVGSQTFASIGHRPTKKRLTFAAAALSIIIISAGTGMYLFSQQKGGVDPKAVASTVEPGELPAF